MSTPQASQNLGGTKPTSIKVEPWSDFPRQSYTIHTDDFCHEKPLVAKFAAKGSRSTLNLKETVSSKQGKWNVDDDLKFWFDLPNNHSLYARIKSSDYIKLHLDHGLRQDGDRQWNFYNSFWTNKSLSKTTLRFGASVIHSRYNTDNRIRINASSGSQQIFWYNRTLAFWKQSKFGLVSVVDLTNQVVQKNNLLIGHVFQNKHEVFLRLQNTGFRTVNPNIADAKSLWDTFTANYVGRLDQTTRLGLEASFALRDNSLKKVEAVVHKVIPKHAIDVKAKVNTKQDVAFLVKRAMWGFQDLLTVSAGFGVNGALSDKSTLHYGLQLDFNV